MTLHPPPRSPIPSVERPIPYSAVSSNPDSSQDLTASTAEDLLYRIAAITATLFVVATLF